METKTIPLRGSIEQTPQTHERVVTPGLDKDVTSVRSQLMTIIEGGASNDQASPSNGNILESALSILHTNKPLIRKEFTAVAAKQTFEIFKTTKGVEETAVGMYAHEVSDKQITIGKVMELNSAKRGAESVKYNPEELLKDNDGMLSVGNGHNHLIGKDVAKMKNGEKTSVQGKSNTDVNSDKNLHDEVDKWGDIEASNFTSMLSMPYEIDGETYWTVAITGLTSKNNEWQQFEYQGKLTHQLIQCPNGKIMRLEDLSNHIQAHILHNRLMAIDNGKEYYKISA